MIGPKNRLRQIWHIPGSNKNFGLQLYGLPYLQKLRPSPPIWQRIAVLTVPPILFLILSGVRRDFRVLCPGHKLSRIKVVEARKRLSQERERIFSQKRGKILFSWEKEKILSWERFFPFLSGKGQNSLFLGKEENYFPGENFLPVLHHQGNLGLGAGVHCRIPQPIVLFGSPSEGDR